MQPVKTKVQAYICAMLLTGFVFALVYSYSYMSIFWHSHSDLIDTSRAGEANHVFRQLKEPSPQEIGAGQQALSKWRNAGRAERHKLADQIISGKVLLGYSQRDVISFLGKPDAFGATDLVGPEVELTGYNAADGESQCDLMIRLKNGKVIDTYLDVNY